VLTCAHVVTAPGGELPEQVRRVRGSALRRRPARRPDPDSLAALAADTSRDGMHRVRAAFGLAAIDRARGTDALAALSEDPTTDDARAGLSRAETARVRRARKNYFRSKEAIGEPPEIDLSQIASYRVLAARLLGFYDRKAAIDHLTALTGAPDEDIADQALTTLAKDFS
jgi:hypothetical protein